MNFEWHRMEKTPEGQLARSQSIDPRDADWLEKASGRYALQAERVISLDNRSTLRDTIAAYARDISSSSGLKRHGTVEKLTKALDAAEPTLFEDIDDEYQRMAFAQALVYEYQKSVH